MKLLKLKNVSGKVLPVVAIVIAAGGFFWLKNKNTQLQQERHNLLLMKSDLEQVYLNIINLQWNLEGAKIYSETQLIDKNNNSLTLSTLVGLSKKPTFVLNFNWDACQDCIKQEMDLIQSELSGHYNIIVIISFDSVNEYLAYMQSNEVPLPIYYAGKSRKIIDGLSYDFGVYGFVLNREGSLSLPHIANSSLPKLSKTYYQFLKEKESAL